MNIVFGVDCDNTLIPFHMHKLLMALENMLKTQHRNLPDDLKEKILNIQKDLSTIRQGFDDDAAERVLDFLDELAGEDSPMKDVFNGCLAFSMHGNLGALKAFSEGRQTIRALISEGNEAFLRFFYTAIESGHKVAIVSNTLFPGILPVILQNKGLTADEVKNVACVAGQAHHNDKNEVELKYQQATDPNLVRWVGKQAHLLKAHHLLSKDSSFSRPADSYVLVDDDNNNRVEARKSGCLVIQECAQDKRYAASVFSSQELMELADSTNHKQTYSKPELSLIPYKKVVCQVPAKAFSFNMPTAEGALTSYLNERLADKTKQATLSEKITKAFKDNTRGSWQALINFFDSHSEFQLGEVLQSGEISAKSLALGASIKGMSKTLLMKKLREVSVLLKVMPVDESRQSMIAN